MGFLELENVTRSYGRTKVLDGLSLRVPRGRIYGFLGRNGAGKTTTIRIILGLIRGGGGEVRIDGKRMDASGLGRIGSIVEFPGFYPNLDGADNLKAFQWLRGTPDPRIAARVLDQVGLAEAGRKKVGAYSLGMKQRLGIARALLHDPDLLILDEPTNGLDPSGMKDVRTLLASLARERGKTVFLSSHNLPEVEQIVDVVGILKDGRMAEEIPIEALRGKCRLGTAIRPSDPQGAARLLRERMGVRCAVEEGGILMVRDRVDAAAANRLLVENGIQVSLLQEAARSLEDYFLGLTA